MRQFINIVTEARRPTTTATPTGFDFMPELERGGALSPVNGSNTVPVPGSGATRSRTRRATRAARVAPEVGAQSAQHLSNLPDMADEIDDAEAMRRAGRDVGGEPEIEPTTENLPAVIRREMVVGGGRAVEPEWHQVKHLPGYMQQGIRALGRSVFQQFTDTPIEDIQVLTTLGDINPEGEVAGMMRWIKRNGTRDDAANIDFSRIMPGYHADVSLWRAKDYSFLLVHDFAGYYVYGWAKKNRKSIGQSKMLAHDTGMQ